MQLDTAVKNLTNHGFSVRVFKNTARSRQRHLQELSGRTIGFGGSVTLQELGLFEALSARTLFSGTEADSRRGVKRLRPRRSI